LLATSSPDEITVREIAEKSGHHHRMIQAWFGGKVMLFLAVHEQLNAEIAQELAPPLGRQGVSERMRMTATLMNWLVAADPDVFQGRDDTPILNQVTSIYETVYGLVPHDARMMAIRTVAGSITAMLFPGPLGISDDDITELATFESRLAELLAASQPEG